MNISSQDYAALSDDAYIDRLGGRRVPGDEDDVVVNGTLYKVLEHVSNSRNGYQGTVYKRAETGEIVVAHRGTEQLAQDGVLADGGMVLTRANVQAEDAIALTGRALGYARKGQSNSGHIPEVTVTGHSLGGALAQVTAHHFGLKGETFNAYGAASLGYRIPEGGKDVLNHVMANDAVSAAAPHYGQVRIYARTQELQMLAAAGFSNSRLNALIPDSPMMAASASLGSHKLGNFLGESSVLSDPGTRTLADGNQRMIEEYRNEIRALRTVTTIISRGYQGGVVDLFDEVRGPLDPGEPSRRESDKQQESRSKDQDASLRMDDHRHFGYSLYSDALRGVHEQDARVGRTPDYQSEQLAGSLAAAMYAAGGTRIDDVVMKGAAVKTYAVEGSVQEYDHVLTNVDTVVAMNTPLEDSSRRMAEHASRLQARQDQELQQGMQRQPDAAHSPRMLG